MDNCPASLFYLGLWGMLAAPVWAIGGSTYPKERFLKSQLLPSHVSDPSLLLDPEGARCDVQSIIERSLEEVLSLCQDAAAARRCATEGSAEWHKRTGEILACAKFTSVLSPARACLRVRARKPFRNR